MRLPTKRARACSSRLTVPTERGASIAPGAGSSWRGPGRSLEYIRISFACFPRSARLRPEERRSHATPVSIVRVWRPAGTSCLLVIAVPTPRPSTPQLLLLPWPLRVRESDFRAVEGSVQRLAKEPFGFFEFAPEERLDLDLVDRMLLAARDEVGSVDVVLLPESAVEESELDALEALLDRHGVTYLQAGLRARSRRPGGLGSNQMHVGVNPRLEKGGSSASSPCGRWFHIRQDKHHRWSLDESQIYQYHLGGALHPHIRWWEAIDVPRRSVQVVEVGEGITIVSLVCEDLAQNDDVAEVIRSIGPTIVSTALLDGPQLTSRWSARYASVLADDPGSAVMTLTSFGMAQRSRPHGHDPSPVIALWKDPSRGTREISLEPGAQGVLLTVCGARATRRTADGRWPVDSGTHYFDVAVHQIRASDARSESPRRVTEFPLREPDSACDRSRRSHDPHRLGRGAGRSARLHAGACSRRARRRPARCSVAARASASPNRPRGSAMRSTRSSERSARPCRRRRAVTRRVAPRRPSRSPRRVRTRQPGAPRAAINARTALHATSRASRFAPPSLAVVLTAPSHRHTGTHRAPALSRSDGSASRSAARVLIPSLGKIRYRWPLTVRCER